jgi:16S rRNA (cytidine1402-2'-O)-methyltransferase
MGKLYVVSTPIGNLNDVSLRALEVLRSADVIACEDTRETRKLLSHYGISARTLSYHEHNKAARTPQIVKRVLGGDDCALVSDRGTPAISDPGFYLVRSAIESGIDVVPVPGASAILASLVVSGLPTDRFFFTGFLPKREGPRRKLLTDVRDVRATLIMYTTSRVLLTALGQMREVLGDRKAVIVREVTKLNEEIVRGTLSELERRIAGGDEHLLGEFVLLVDGVQEPGEVNSAGIEPLLEALYSKPPDTVKEGVAWLVARLGIRRNLAYEKVAEFLSEDPPPGR